MTAVGGADSILSENKNTISILNGVFVKREILFNTE